MKDADSTTATPRIIELCQVRGEAAGGKAAGLSRLIKAGLPVPAGFAIRGATPDALPPDLAHHYAALGGGPVAVRSSAAGEDSSQASFAGQYTTVLGVEGIEHLRRAIVECLKSAANARARSYQQERADASPMEAVGGMSVVVQRMVPARAAGVVFTAHPVTHRRAHVVIDAIRGLGEGLVDGSTAPDHHVVGRDGRVLVSQPAAGEPVLAPPELRAVLEGALAAESHLGEPLDLEWAIDDAGAVHWLQARPITTLEADLNELDTPLPDASHVFTRCNIGEMFPGAATPLSISVTARSIDVGMQMMHMAVGAQRERQAENRFVAVFFGHLFLDLTSMSEIATHALLSSTEQMCLSLCGRRITEFEIHTGPPPPLHRRLANSVRYAGYVLGQRRARRRLQSLARELEFPSADSAHQRWLDIEERFEVLVLAMHYHLISSAGAGILSSVLLGIAARGRDPDASHHAEVAQLLAGAEEVESADIAAGARRIQEAVANHPDGVARCADAGFEEALDWLRSPASGRAGEELRDYLARHGHRAVKELELRQAEWALDSRPLIRSIQVGLRAQPAFGSERAEADTACRTPSPAAGHGRLVNLLVKLAHGAVRSREETKSGLVLVTVRFKAAYRDLGKQLVEEQRLTDADAVFFLTQRELGALASGHTPELRETAVARRTVFPRQAALEFPDVFIGEPTPLQQESSAPEAERPDQRDVQRGVVGAPVSRGQVTGLVRVVRRLEEADSLRAGEILVAPVTDVGWTPYFSLIAGLVTDVGSAVSHGAVVAREYGLPAIVNTRNATRVLRTGDRVSLDGDSGRVQVLASGSSLDADTEKK